MFYQSLFASRQARENSLNATVSSGRIYSDADSEHAGVKITENFFS